MNLCDINDIKFLLAKHGFRFSKSMGQNFLTQSWVPQDIADEAGLDENTGVLEVGTGIGCLTYELAKRAGKVVSVELDRSLEPVLHETLGELDNWELVFGDIMKTDLEKLVQEHFDGLRPVVCANLPYNITTPVLTAFLESKCFDSITVMVQREVALRICANPGTADYGAFTLLCGWYAEPEFLFEVPADCFIPQPKVCSAVIRMRKRQAPPCEVKSEELMFRVIRAAFNQRRKTLVNALSSGISELPKDKLGELIVECGHDIRVRGEVLSLKQFADLSNKIYDNISR